MDSTWIPRASLPYDAIVATLSRVSVVLFKNCSNAVKKCLQTRFKRRTSGLYSATHCREILRKITQTMLARISEGTFHNVISSPRQKLRQFPCILSQMFKLPRVQWISWILILPPLVVNACEETFRAKKSFSRVHIKITHTLPPPTPNERDNL